MIWRDKCRRGFLADSAIRPMRRNSTIGRKCGTSHWLKAFAYRWALTQSILRKKDCWIWAEVPTKVRLSPPLVFLAKRVEQFRREFPPHVPNYKKISPGKLFQWFGAIDLEVHPDFSTKYVSVTSADARDRHTVKETKTDRREVDSVAQLFAAIAIDAYGYDPTALRSPIPKEIRNIAASLGMEISDDTIRKYLKLGAKFVSSDWKLN